MKTELVFGRSPKNPFWHMFPQQSSNYVITHKHKEIKRKLLLKNEGLDGVIRFYAYLCQTYWDVTMNSILFITWNPSLTFGPFRWYSLCWLIGLALAYFIVRKLFYEQKIAVRTTVKKRKKTRGKCLRPVIHLLFLGYSHWSTLRALSLLSARLFPD